jgi:hypothetical protein
MEKRKNRYPSTNRRQKLNCKHPARLPSTTLMKYTPHSLHCLFIVKISIVSISQWMSRNSSVGITPGYGLDGRVSIPGREFVAIPQRPDEHWGPPSLLSNGYRRIFPQGRRLEREAHHSPLSSAEVKNIRAISSRPHMSS